MKRRFVTWVLLVSMLINCFSVTSFADECKHINKSGHSPVYVYEYEDEDYHISNEPEVIEHTFEIGNRYKAYTSSGVMIEMYIDVVNNKIISAFPVFE